MLESNVMVLTSQKAQLDREAATVRSAGIEQKSATSAMMDEIVSRAVRHRGWPPHASRNPTGALRAR